MSNKNFEFEFSDNALDILKKIKTNPSKKGIAKAVVKSLEFMSENLRHPSLNTHKYNELTGPNGEEIYESYAQNKTPGAYRIFWYYGSGRKKITILDITPHP